MYSPERCECVGKTHNYLELILKDAGVVRCKKCGHIWAEKNRDLVDALSWDIGPVVFPTDAE